MVRLQLFLLFEVFEVSSIYVGKVINNRGQKAKFTLIYRVAGYLRLIGRLFFIFIVSEVNSRLLCLKMFVQVAA
jgi:hypothetical protein